MAEQFAVTQIPGMETGEIPPVPVDRDEKTVIIYSLVDPVWDIDVLPLTYTNSRWSAFFYRADEKHLRRVLPDCLELDTTSSSTGTSTTTTPCSARTARWV